MAWSQNVTLVGYEDLDRRPAIKLAMHTVSDRWYLYVGHIWEPGWSILDVTDPQQPRFVRFMPGPPNTWTPQIQVADGLMIAGMEEIYAGWAGGEARGASGQTGDGFDIYDLADPEDPQRVGTWSTGGGGTHRNFYNGGRYVHAAAKAPGFIGHHYVCVDIDDPTDPQVVGRWWWPGQNAGAGEEFSPEDARRLSSGRPLPNHAPIHLHGPAYVVGDRAYCSWGRAGMVVLDVSDVTNPRKVSDLGMYPPLGGGLLGCHTAVPFPERNLAIVNSEATNDPGDHPDRQDGTEPCHIIGLVDISDETDPILISSFPLPDVPPGYPAADFYDRKARFGPHNQHHPQGMAYLRPSDDYVFVAYFSGGLQVFDISSPRRPTIAGYYIPDDPRERRGLHPTELVTQFEDVLVDTRGYIYCTEKNSGVYILQFDGA